MALLLAGGCLQSHEEARLEPLDVSIETPAGTHRLGTSVDPNFVEIQLPTLSIRAHAPSVSVTLAPFAKTPQITVEPNPREQNVQFEPQRAFYQQHGGPELPLAGTQTDLREPGGEWIATQWRLDLSPPLSGIVLASSKLSPATIRAIQAIEGKRHRFYVPFRIAGQPYAIDATFALVLERVWSLGNIGGMP